MFRQNMKSKNHPRSLVNHHPKKDPEDAKQGNRERGMRPEPRRRTRYDAAAGINIPDGRRRRRPIPCHENGREGQGPPPPTTEARDDILDGSDARLDLRDLVLHRRHDAIDIDQVLELVDQAGDVEPVDDRVGQEERDEVGGAGGDEGQRAEEGRLVHHRRTTLVVQRVHRVPVHRLVERGRRSQVVAAGLGLGVIQLLLLLLLLLPQPIPQPVSTVGRHDSGHDAKSIQTLTPAGSSEVAHSLHITGYFDDALIRGTITTVEHLTAHHGLIAVRFLWGTTRTAQQREEETFCNGTERKRGRGAREVVVVRKRLKVWTRGWEESGGRARPHGPLSYQVSITAIPESR